MDTPYLRRVEKRASIIFYIRSSCTCNENLWAKLHNNALKVQVLSIECTMYMEKDFFFFFVCEREGEKERDYLYNYIHIYKLGFRMFSKVWNCWLTYIIWESRNMTFHRLTWNSWANANSKESWRQLYNHFTIYKQFYKFQI